jgi:tetratricopeptide (TPR) repeat protein
MRRLTALLLALLAVAHVAGGAESASREHALAALADTSNVETRRGGARELAATGTMADLPALVKALRDPDPGVRGIAEAALWEVWSRSGDDDVDRLLAVGIEQMNERDLGAAIETFSEVIRRKPEFAEGWNKRATAYFVQGDYRRSLTDCDEVMKRNPYHYGALSGYGMIYLRLDLPARALEYFEKALAVNPNLPQVQETIEAIKSLLIQQRKETT